MRRLEAERLDLMTSDRSRAIGRTALTVASLGQTSITREVAQPGWRWSEDVKPVVGTDLCTAWHRMYVVSGRLEVVVEGASREVVAGEAVVIPPGHDAWVVGDEPCELVDFSPTYSNLIAAGQAYRELTDPGQRSDARARSPVDAAAELRRHALAGRLDSGSVEIVLASVGHTSRRVPGPAGLTPREVQVLVLIATGASVKQVAHLLGIAPKTAATHVERIYSKIAVTSRAAATRFAIQHGLVDPIS